MADIEKKYLDLVGLEAYNEKIKKVISDGDATVAADLAKEVARADAAEKAIDAKVDALDTKVGEIPADAEAKTVIGYIDEKVEAINSDADNLAGRVTQAEKDIDAIEADYLKAADKTELQGNIDKVSAKVTTLIGDDADKSVRTIANEELTKQLIPENAAEALDTLQEIAQWIQDHPGEASAMNKAIQDLQALVGQLPENDPAYANVVDFVQKLVKAEETRAAGVESGLDARLKAAEALLAGDGEGTIAEQIEKAIAAEKEAREKADAELKAAVEKAQADIDAFVRIDETEIDALFTTASVGE